ncbi:MAG: ABC transporter ATP-binding protein [Verrucomicrobia bacterium]|nr:ABC transporter ATP-binding protein [Verrucomicrobiota bacterium]
MPEDLSKSTDTPFVMSNGAVLKRLLKLVWRYRGGCINVLALQTVLLTLGITGLGFMGLGIDYVRYAFTANHTSDFGNIIKAPHWPFGFQPPSDWSSLHVLGMVSLCILALALIRGVLNYHYTYSLAKLVQARVVVDLRAQVYNKMIRLSFRFFDKNASGSLINRVTGDVQSVRMFVDQVVMQSVILLVSLMVYVTYMGRIHLPLTLACLATSPFLWMATVRFSRLVKPAHLESRRLLDEQVLALSENLHGVHVIKGFAVQDQEIAKFAARNRAVRDQKNWIFKVVSVFQPIIGALSHLNIVILLAYGGALVIQHELAPPGVKVGITIGEMLVFSGLLQQFSQQVASIATIANNIQQSLTSAQRVFEILDTPVEIASPPNPLKPSRLKGKVAFENVSFAYRSDSPVLDDVSFVAEPGECIAILGATGSGKSTLLSLIPRFYDPGTGTVRIDGEDARRYDVAALRQRIGVVFQESFLFSNSVAANIAFGHPEATREQIEKAAEIAAAAEFIRELPKGFDTILSEAGNNLSGGQRQRLAIARAILLEPEILLLDDPTAAIDPETEEEILVAMDQAIKGRTTFLVAHRLSTLRRANRIIVLENGRIIESGTHEQLLQNRRVYALAAAAQSPDARSLQLLAKDGNGPAEVRT